MIEYPDKKKVSLTQTGAAQAPSTATPVTNNEQLQARLKSMLKDKAPIIFNILEDGPPHVREHLAAQVGHSNVQSKGFKDALKQMFSLKMVEHPDSNNNLIQLTGIAFPLGRAGNNDFSPCAPARVDMGSSNDIKIEH